MKNYYKTIFTFLSLVAAIKCENCVTYEFGSTFYNTFNNGSAVCNGMSHWTLGYYDDINVDAIHQDSEFFISPDATLSCVSSYTFEMKSTGVLEVYVYMEAKTNGDQIVVLANEISDDDNNVVTGTAMLTPLSSNYVDGWHILKINLFGTDTFTGYVTFLGIASPDAKVIIDSFRYIPPQYEEECFVYDGEITLPPPNIPVTVDCVTYDFEEDFDTQFSSARGLCTGFNVWQLENYSSIPIANPSTDSQQFITPGDGISCASSFTFQVEANGVLEVNVYMESASNIDQIAVLAHQIVDENNDAVTGSIVLTPLHEDYVDGWHTLSVELTGEGIYKGYVSFIGMAAEESIVLIDSFKYIPPESSSSVCQIYEDDDFNQEPTTPAPIGTGEDCITYNFETDFEHFFNTNAQLCNGYSSWHLGTYSSIAVDTIDPDSHTYIAPNDSSSCVSSFTFNMKPGGVVDVNVFMSSVSDLDYIIVLAKKLVPGGIDTVTGFELYYASNENFVEGWNKLSVTVRDFDTFTGYITLIGSTAEESLVLIDSFRYTPPESSDTCDIY